MNKKVEEAIDRLRAMGAKGHWICGATHAVGGLVALEKVRCKLEVGHGGQHEADVMHVIRWDVDVPVRAFADDEARERSGNDRSENDKKGR